MKIEIPQDIVLTLQKADLEQQARKEIIAYILTTDLDISTERFLNYQKDFEEKLQIFNNLKLQFSEEWVKPLKKDATHWKITYETRMLEVE